MKRISMILMAFAMMMTMTQCKKNEETNPNETVTITLNVKGNNDAKVDVNPEIGTVDFETGDKVYVGSGGKYVGFLTHNGTNFVGNITNPTEGQPLQFYFLGNVNPQETLSAGITEECSVIISDQTEHLPVISCAPSFENYVSGVTAYTGHLLNKCALVKFIVTTPSNSPICITGMKNKVTVVFSQNTVTSSIDGEGIIKLPTGSGENVEKWAILLPQEALEEGEEGTVHSIGGIYSGKRPPISSISENDYLGNGIGVTVSSRSFVSGLFTINNESDQVRFSPGNLQYIGTASPVYWKFADNQLDFFDETIQNNNSQTINRDLFAWGTSGYNHGAVCYQPWSHSESDQDYYAYGLNWTNLDDYTGQADWGYNAIINGGNVENSWRTLRAEEWYYLLLVRTTVSGLRYAKAKIGEVNGVILLPDDWDESNYSLCLPDYDRANYESNTITDSIWESVFEIHGAVFLPATKYNNSSGCYWSSTGYNISTTHSAHYVLFGNNIFLPDEGYYDHRYYRQSVRLVQDY